MTTTMITRRPIGLAVTLLAGALTLAPAANAQDARADSRWQGLLGCWQPVTASSADTYTAWMEQRARDAEAPRLCIIPTTNARSVEFLTVAGGKVTTRDTVDAGNPHLARKRDGCDGWEGAAWSTNGRRVYLSSEYSCDGNVTRSSSGMLAMSSDGQLMHIDEIASGGAKSVRVARYRSVAAPEGIAIDSTLVARADAIPVTAARASMSSALTGADIVDAVNNVDPLVVEAWLVERGDRFVVDAKRLAALADAGVPGRITDLMVALAYPGVFALDRPTRVASAIAPAGSGRTVYVTLPPSDPFGYQSGFGYRPYGYSPYGYSPYGYSGYGYDGYRYNGYGYGYLYQPPVVIVRGNGGSTARPHGHVVNGRGYTRDPSSSTAETPSPRSGAGSGTTPSSGSTSSGSTTSSSSGSSSSGEPRHAKPRP
jgi:hypothetical protein